MTHFTVQNTQRFGSQKQRQRQLKMHNFTMP